MLNSREDEIDKDSNSFNPYENKEPSVCSESSSDESSEQFDDGSEVQVSLGWSEGKKKTKVYYENSFTKLDSKICLHKIESEIEKCEEQEFRKERKNKDRADRATVEQVLDQRTRKILLKLINNQTVHEINGCLSTGKQANVYHAINTTTNQEYAIKIYKTSILIFKDRDRYVEGQFRFRKGYCSKNPRKMVRMWAEKELRNLKRMEGTVRCPVGLLVKSNVLVMEFLGKERVHAPKLKDVPFTDVQKFSELYLGVVKVIRVLYQECKLIHADLSEYNLLYHQEQLFVIDVSQSVEHDHPQALDFLRRDINNINQFFTRKSVNVFSDWNTFQYVVALNIKKGEELRELESLMEESIEENSQGEQLAFRDNVFKKIAIPRNLGNISMEKVEREFFTEQHLPMEHRVVTGLATEDVIKEQAECSSDSESSGSASEEQQAQQNAGGQQKYEGLSKMERKHKVKEEKREKRKDKMPKKKKHKLTKK